MILAVPEPEPVTIPVEEPIVAIAPLLLLHVPLVVASLNNVVFPVHTYPMPEIANGT